MRAPTLVLRTEGIAVDLLPAEVLANAVVLPAEPGLAFGQAVGAAWAAGRSGLGEVVLAVPAAELQASLSPALAAFAVRERLTRLAVVVVDPADDAVIALAMRGFTTETVGAEGQIAGALERARGRGRPALIVCRGCSTRGPALRALTPTLVTGRAPIAIPFEGGARDTGAFATGVALNGQHTPIAVVPLAEADGLKPALRAAARLGLPSIFVATEDRPPADALWSLRLVPGVEVWRPAGALEAGVVLEAALGVPGPTVVSLGPDPDPMPIAPLVDISAGVAILADAPEPATTILATGAEVALALAVKSTLETPVRVVAIPSVGRFRALSDLARRRLLGPGPVVVLEAGIAEPWRALVGPDALILCADEDLRLGRVLAALGVHPRARRAER